MTYLTYSAQREPARVARSFPALGSSAADGAASQCERARNGSADGVEDEGACAAQAGPVGFGRGEPRVQRGEAGEAVMIQPVRCLQARDIDDLPLRLHGRLLNAGIVPVDHPKPPPLTGDAAGAGERDVVARAD